MHSALYFGQVRHRRFSPRGHIFNYRLFMVYVDLDELESVFRGRWLWSTHGPALAWWRRADYLGDPQIPLAQAVRARVEQETGVRPRGPIRMLTHLRYFGYGFNPVTFYYCFDAEDKQVETIVAEITNTPWNERHSYVLTDAMNCGHPDIKRYQFSKAFHVSPFLDMAIDYDWRFSAPGSRLNVHMQDLKAGNKLFDATLKLQRRPITATNLAYALTAFPFLTLKVIGGIYWQALCLWIKRAPFHTHPHKADNSGGAKSANTR